MPSLSSPYASYSESLHTQLHFASEGKWGSYHHYVYSVTIYSRLWFAAILGSCCSDLCVFLHGGWRWVVILVVGRRIDVSRALYQLANLRAERSRLVQVDWTQTEPSDD